MTKALETMKTFTTETMIEIYRWLHKGCSGIDTGGAVTFEVCNPDLGGSAYAGTRFQVGPTTYRHRGYKAWTDLAELLGCRMLTPTPLSEHTVAIRFEKLDTDASFHHAPVLTKEEKYGADSPFAAINKNEEPAFMAAYLHALERTGIADRHRILDLGVNSGDEFDLIRHIVGTERFDAMELVGIDHSASAVDIAKTRFPGDNVTFHVHDINHLDVLQLEPFDLIVSIGTLQSPGIDFKPLFMSLVQNHLVRNGGALVLGFPNCRWMGGEMIYGAKAPNYPYPEQSLLYKDVYFCKKYLQQKKFRVTLTGKNYLFLTATPIGRQGILE